jgi:hypothetical protein
MAGNRKLIKTNLKGHRSETTERNERLKIWLTFWSGIITAVVSFFVAR